MDVYDRARRTADRLIAKRGQSAVLIKTSEDPHSPTDPWDPGDIENPTPAGEYPVKVITLEYSMRDVDGTLIQQDDLRVYMAVGTLPVKPTDNDRLRIGEVEYEIIRIKPLAPGGKAVLYDGQIR